MSRILQDTLATPNARPRLLVLTPRDPYPVLGGDRVRIHRLARELARDFDLTLLTLCTSRKASRAPIPDDGVFREVIRVALPGWRSWLNCFPALLTRQPLQIAYYRSRAFQQQVDRLAQQHDGVLAHLVRTAQYIRGWPGVRVLEMTDAISLGMARVAQRGPGPFDWRRTLYRLESRRLIGFERRMLTEFDMVSLVSPVDLQHLRQTDRSPDGRLLVVPSGVDLPAESPRRLHDRPAREIVFVGNLHSLQNLDAVRFFVTEVLPLLHRRAPELVLRVIGPAPRDAARKLAQRDGVVMVGVVSDLAPELSRARVGICPVLSGAGMQNKILDYMAHGVPVVSSSIGLEGLDARDGEHLLLARDPQEWCERVWRLMEDPVQGQQLADAAHELVRVRYDWQRNTAVFRQRLRVLLSPGCSQIHAES